uniref:S-adenosylmethionine-dependent methyltransferase domain-containing protein n=1 Tax=Chromera velia CCMP2878 TaxID=1169474 RepID=A0A0G4HX25_9ALVE|eukprot:Cvel_9170.t1-p1 / transcript=Cvel_9170.t1 / gene=Cvel_9170 / organism=Chromera_velia_CCMP2878 / gene_product=Ribosomal RNA large subunit methyltransferase I, putative / transcript_product=Ribosomal RNA large subunit methyltransferase I, putative / location=Cvel_scaffold522:35705-37423(-) / protein_length=573 / sequence_SO=supercontig / SO=protein_coding / is_pseudo=false
MFFFARLVCVVCLVCPSLHPHVFQILAFSGHTVPSLSSRPSKAQRRQGREDGGSRKGRPPQRHRDGYRGKRRKRDGETAEERDELPLTPPDPKGLDAAVRVQRGKARLFEEGCRTIYGNAVCKPEKPIDANSLVTVYDHCGSRFVGFGVFNPDSMFRVRLLSSLPPDPSLSSRENLQRAVRSNLETACHLRKALGLPSEDTSAFRLVNGEGDGLPGLCVDVLTNDLAVVSSSARWCEWYEEEIRKEVASAVGGLTGVEGDKVRLIWRRTESRLNQDGWKETEKADGVEARNDLLMNEEERRRDGKVLCWENGLQFTARPFKGQKTGVYCDQRENRKFLRSLSALKGDGEVLDVFSFHGGFAVNALVGGAKTVIAVDSSADACNAAVEDLQSNREGRAKETGSNSVELMETGTEWLPSVSAETSNGTSGEVVRVVRGDGETAMRECAEAVRSGRCGGFDVVVLDPPKLAPSVQHLKAAKRKYERLNGLAMQCLRKEGGVLLTHTCSAALASCGDPSEFLDVLESAALSAERQDGMKRRLVTMRVAGAAPDHPVDLKAREGAYLFSVALHVSPRT